MLFGYIRLWLSTGAAISVNIPNRIFSLKVAAAILCSYSVTSSGKSLQDSVLDVPPDGIVAVQINRSSTIYRFEMRGDGISYPVLNPELAENLKLRSNIFGNLLGIQANVGPIAIAGHTGKVDVAFDGQEETLRALWFERPIAPQSDGSLGPGAVTQSIVKIHVAEGARSVQPSAVSLQTEDNRVGTNIEVGKTTIFVRFNPLRQHSIASAGAAQAIALAYKGQWSGEKGSDLIDFGITRPVRELSLSVPLKVGGLSISKLLVRDFGQVTGVSQESSQGNADPNEVVLPEVSVTAQSTKTKPAYNLTLGRDVLDGCESITFNKSTKQIQLACKP